MDLGKQISDRITEDYYPAGHMIYHVQAAREKLRQDVGAMMKAALAAQ
jgi:hypothetical protein